MILSTPPLGIKIIYARCSIANELSGNMALVYKFSDPDGMRGKSGWSFGVTQLDLSNNPNASLALMDMDFTTLEIRALKDQTANITLMNDKLAMNKTIVDDWDLKQINECISWPFALCREILANLSGYDTFLHIADYHNQLRFSRGGRLYRFIRSCKNPITPSMIHNFKMTLDWGFKRPDDVNRRYENIVRITNENRTQISEWEERQ